MYGIVCNKKDVSRAICSKIQVDIIRKFTTLLFVSHNPIQSQSLQSNMANDQEKEEKPRKVVTKGVGGASVCSVPRSTSQSRSKPRKSKSQSQLERLRRKYHKMAYKNKLKPITEKTVDESEAAFSTKIGGKIARRRIVDDSKKKIIAELARTDGDANSEAVHDAIEALVANKGTSTFCPRKLTTRPDMWCSPESQLEDTWISMTKPDYKDCLGRNEQNDCMYTLGRMSFGMLHPTQLVCSIQGTFNDIQAVNGMDEDAVKHVPANLKANVRDGNVQVRTYSIVTAFTIEPYNELFGENSPNKGIVDPIQGLMTVYSYIVPYPKQDRFSVWFTGGAVEINGGADKWRSHFNRESIPNRTLGERAMLFAAGLLMGATTSDEMDDNGKLSFELTRPIAANIDLLYMDEMIRVMRTGKGTTYIFARTNPDDYSSSSDESFSSKDSSRCSDTGLHVSSEHSLLARDRAPSLPTRNSTLKTPQDPPKWPGRCRSPVKPSWCAGKTQTPPRRRPIQNQDSSQPPQRPSRSQSPVPPLTRPGRKLDPAKPPRRPGRIESPIQTTKYLEKNTGLPPLLQHLDPAKPPWMSDHIEKVNNSVGNRWDGMVSIPPKRPCHDDCTALQTMSQQRIQELMEGHWSTGTDSQAPSNHCTAPKRKMSSLSNAPQQPTRHGSPMRSMPTRLC
eukprot:scaffold297_cov171-Amphora_coffeaeformis.AAC.18